MNIRMDNKTRTWIENQGSICTVNLVAYPGQVNNKRLLVDFECSTEPPHNLEDYYRLELDGAALYFHKKLEQKKKDVELRVSGREPFEYLEVKGFKRLFTEAV
jgi:hypothetical protein